MGKIWSTCVNKRDEDLDIGGVDVPAYSEVFKFNGNPSGEFGIELKMSSAAGDPSVAVWLELGNSLPTTPCASDPDFVVSDRDTIITTVENELVHFAGFNATPAVYGRLKFVGTADNPVDTVLTRGNVQEAA